MLPDEIIIELVRDTPWLYNKKYKKYKNTVARRKKWNAFSRYLLENCNVRITSLDLEKRWDKLRIMFRREHKKKTLPVPPGSECIKEEEWPLYRNMEFLEPFIVHRSHHIYHIPREKKPPKTRSLEKIIIDLVRDTPWLYDQKHENYKDSAAKKNKWKEMSLYLRDVCNVEMSPVSLEKRWISLRVMFRKEHRKQLSPIPSASLSRKRKEWALYRYMIFLAPFTEFRKSKPSLQLPSEQSGDNAEQHDEEDSDLRKSQYEHTERRSNRVVEPKTNHIYAMSTCASSTCPSTSTNSHSCSVTSIPATNAERIRKRKRKVAPCHDEFAERQRKNNEKLKEEQVEAQSQLDNSFYFVSLLSPTEHTEIISDRVVEPNTNPIRAISTSASSTCSSISTSSRSCSVTLIPDTYAKKIRKRKRKVTPCHDEFAERQRKNNEKLKEEQVEAQSQLDNSFCFVSLLSPTEHTEKISDRVVEPNTNPIRAISTSASSTCSSISTSSRSCSVTLIPDTYAKKIRKRKRKVAPCHDEFAERQRKNNEKLEEEQMEAQSQLDNSFCFVSLLSPTEHTEIISDRVVEPNTNPIRAISTSASSTCSSISTSSRSCNVTLIPDTYAKKIEKRKRKVSPRYDEFPERKRKNNEKYEEEQAEASTEISQAASTVSLHLTKKTEEKYDGYMMAIKEGLMYVPHDKKTECLIEVFKVIKKYEQRT